MEPLEAKILGCGERRTISGVQTCVSIHQVVILSSSVMAITCTMVLASYIVESQQKLMEMVAGSVILVAIK